MVTKGMEQIYQEVADILVKMIPESWRDIFLYAEMGERYRELFFYYFPDIRNIPVSSLEMADLFKLDEQLFERLEDQLYDAFLRLHQEFILNGQEIWTTVTFRLNHEGKMKAKFDYDDLSSISSAEKQTRWEMEYLDSQLQEL